MLTTVRREACSRAGASSSWSPGEVLGGAERGSIDYASAFARDEGADVHICALDDRPGPGRAVAAELGIPWSSIRTPWVGGKADKAASLVRVAAGLRRLQADVLVSATNLPNVVCGLTWRMSGATLAVWQQCDVLGSVRIGDTAIPARVALDPRRDQRRGTREAVARGSVRRRSWSCACHPQLDRASADARERGCVASKARAAG